jgi:hypothetical protein
MTRLKKKNPRIDSLIPNVRIQCLKNDKNSMDIVHFERETFFYNISNLEYNMSCHKMILRLGLLGIYIRDKGYNYNERVP